MSAWIAEYIHQSTVEVSGSADNDESCHLKVRVSSKFSARAKSTFKKEHKNTGPLGSLNKTETEAAQKETTTMQEMARRTGRKVTLFRPYTDATCCAKISRNFFNCRLCAVLRAPRLEEGR